MMKLDTGVRRRRAVIDLGVLLWCATLQAWCVAQAQAARPAGPVGPSDRPEAYFNGSSYVRLSQPISLKQLVGLSFRTCVGGELFSQRYEGYTLHVTALFEKVVVSWARPGQPHREASIARETLDNRWHWLALRYKPSPPTLLLELDKETQVVSNVTQYPELLSGGALESESAVLLVGNLYSGCLHEGPQLEFHAATAQDHNVLFGACPLTTDECKDRKDVLRIQPKDHCYNEPCMRHGTCISRHDRYECHCTARYTGNNCEVDAGSPCQPNPCLHGARCQEDAAGDYLCLCTDSYRGPHCETEQSVEGACESSPCLNNGTCSVPAHAHAQDYLCDCLPGYTGRRCETETDECSPQAEPCLNGGRCRASSCDCTGTGYTGPRCEVNVNECASEPRLCGHGVCYDTPGAFVCACRPLYTGERCQLMSACASSPCGAGGACVEEGAAWRCVCARGYLPPLCTPAPPPPPPPAPAAAPCADVVCPANSHCQPAATGLPTMVTGVMVTKQSICVCDPGYYGAPGAAPNCSTLEQACDAAVCQNGATCSLGADHFNCTCAPGYRGLYCEVGGAGAGPGAGAGAGQGAGKALEPKGVERCATSPCLHATICTDHTFGFRCECEAGWGGARCDVPASSSAPAPAPAPLAATQIGACSGPGCDAVDCRVAPCPNRQECVETDEGAWQCAEGSPGGGGGGVGAAESPCAPSPCYNGTCVPLAAATGAARRYRCVCPPGNNGHNCELDIDECALMPKICNHGVCVNAPGSYQCYCRPGYTGDSCEQDIDECLSAPCRNGGSCQNLENNFECECPPGFEGKDCSVNIDECLSSPCAAGSTCVDGVAGYHCVCRDGLTGPHCELDIDDCESSPCQHGGRCVDELNGYRCECAGTGHAGPDCELNVDECASQPCRHGGRCRDELNDYRCLCHPGYTGKNCETDIDECASSPCQHGGVCLELSNATQYRDDAAPLQVGPQPHMLLPDVFYQQFSYENASGFVCVCVTGARGARCETDVDECASAPCVHGACADALGSYSCACAAGYSGARCELEVDECAGAPCEHGACVDGRARYSCVCAPGWGGRNCSVPLRGCAGAPCLHGAACRPWLLGETRHGFNCTCLPGYAGHRCQRITTMSLEANSYAEVNTSREEGYDISFRFKTTLGNGLLAMGRGLTYFFLELADGRLNLHSSLLNKWEGVYIGSKLNDSNWQKVFVTINSSHVVLAANEEQTIYPISQAEGAEKERGAVTSFPSTRLGAAGSGYATLTHGPNSFVGCFQDVLVNGAWVLPEDNSTEAVPADSADSADSAADSEGGGYGGGAVAWTRTRGVSARCPRRAQCSPNPCRAGGRCEDRWSSYTCACARPALGASCQYTYTAATFGHESAASRAAVAVAVSERARRAVHAALAISMFVRTRKPTGDVFYLGSGPRFGQTDETLVGASLRAGELLVHLRFNQTPEEYTVGGTRLDNGYPHLIEVVRNSTLVQVKLNGTEYFRKSISAAKQLDAQVLYLGGPPPSPSPAPASPAPASPPPAELEQDDSKYFKGVIQDVQISNGLETFVVELFPLGVAGLRVPASFGAVSLGASGALRGVVSDDLCAAAPCLHDATCTNTWNDFRCDCPRGYKGKTCAEVEFCQLQGCPLNSHCRNLDGGYECLSEATFDGINTTLTYQLRVPAGAEPPPPPRTIDITYRTKWGGTILHAYSSETEQWFTLAALGAQATAAWRLGGGGGGDGGGGGGALPAARRMRAPAGGGGGGGGGWTRVRFNVTDTHLIGAFVEADGKEAVGFSERIDVSAWQALLAEGHVSLGGPRPVSPLATTSTTSTSSTTTSTSTTTTAAAALTETSTDTSVWEYSDGDDPAASDNSYGEYFKGCLGAVHVGGLLLPYFTEEELFVGAAAALLASQPHYALLAGRAWGAAAGVGCVLCLESDCAHGGHCRDLRTDYSCVCPAPYAGDHCQIDIDECESNECQNGATCQDGLAAYTCVCAEGYEGQFCELDIDECLSSPCGGGGTCSNLPGAYSCACPGSAPPPATPCAAPPPRAPCRPPLCHPRRGLCRDHGSTLDDNTTCACYAGFEGAHCEHAYCELTPCLHGGRCDVEAEEPRCVCPSGYSGRRCEEGGAEGGEEGVAGGGAGAAGACGDVTCLHGGRCGDDVRCHCDNTGYGGARCETDVDECAEGAVQCAPGECRNLPGTYTCLCGVGYCGDNCALPDPCLAAAPAAEEQGGEQGDVQGAVQGPCAHGGLCEQRCTNVTDYVCHCAEGWGGDNCTEQAVGAGAGAGAGAGGGGDGAGGALGGWRAALGAAGALAAAALGAAGAAGAARARRQRATRGTYSPSGQEYCNPRAAGIPRALQPPPEERLI